MKAGEKSVLICKSDYAYGAQGSPPKIPANATLHFEVRAGWMAPSCLEIQSYVLPIMCWTGKTSNLSTVIGSVPEVNFSRNWQ